MGAVENFLTSEEEQEIVEAIRQAEENTTGEIRVHIEGSSNGDIEKRTFEVFHELNMHETKLHNGVLIYIAVHDHNFTVYGDMGINKVVADDFWDCTVDLIQNHFKEGRFKQGLVEGVLNAGKQLKTHFPKTDNDTNELPNTISKGDI